MTLDTPQRQGDVTRPEPSGRHSRQVAALGFAAKYGTVVGLVAMIVAFSIAEPNTFPSASNFADILDQVALTAIIAGGLTVVLVCGEFDLSIGYQASLAGVLTVGFITRQGLPPALAIALVLCIGGGIGLVNGIIVTKLGVNALITTLGIGTLCVGVNYAYSSGIPIDLGSHTGFIAISQGKVFGISHDVIFMLVLLGVLWIVLNRTETGQQMQAVGGNAEAALLSGIRVDRVRIKAFIVAGVCAAATGILLASRVGSAEITAGDNYLLDAFAAAFLGSAALRDGEFHIVGTLIGVIIVGVGFNGLAIVGAPTYSQYFVKGGLLVLSVALSSVARRYVRRGR